MYNEELMYEDTKGEFIEKETERVDRTPAYFLLGFALFINVVSLIKTHPVVIGIFAVGALLGMVAGYKLAFDRIRRK